MTSKRPLSSYSAHFPLGTGQFGARHVSFAWLISINA
jgi:hypothetical protein